VSIWFDHPALGPGLYVHEAGGVRWFDRDAFETMTATVARLTGHADADRVAALAAGSEAAGYRVDDFVSALRRDDDASGVARAEMPGSRGRTAGR
jgi:hypothetical protein